MTTQHNTTQHNQKQDRTKQDNTIQHKTRQQKTRQPQDNSRQHKTTQANSSQDRARCNTRQDRTRTNTRQGKATTFNTWGEGKQHRGDVNGPGHVRNRIPTASPNAFFRLENYIAFKQVSKMQLSMIRHTIALLMLTPTIEQWESPSAQYNPLEIMKKQKGRPITNQKKTKTRR